MQLTQLFWRFVGCQSTTGKTTGQTLDDASITTAAQSINTAHGGTAGATKSFTLNGSIFGNPGDLIDLRLKVAGSDAGDATADIRANIQFLGLSYTRYTQ